MSRLSARRLATTQSATTVGRRSWKSSSEKAGRRRRIFGGDLLTYGRFGRGRICSFNLDLFPRQTVLERAG